MRRGDELQGQLKALRSGGPVSAFVAWLAARELWVAEPPMTTVLPDGSGPALQVFSSLERLHKRRPDAAARPLPGSEVLRLVTERWVGLVLDTSGPRPQAVTAEQVLSGTTCQPRPRSS